jgi:hypothetical protein
MHFSFNLLRIKGFYMFRALFAHSQVALHKRHLVYVVRTSDGSGTVAVKLQPCQSQLTLYARNIPNAVSVAPPEDEQVMFETCRGLWFSINWMKIASRWFHYTDLLAVSSDYSPGELCTTDTPRLTQQLRSGSFGAKSEQRTCNSQWCKYQYVQGDQVEIKTPTRFNLIGCSMTAPHPPCYRPTVLLRHL